jgi:uncharacterized membrane protein YcaP (DUF421 family)
MEIVFRVAIIYGVIVIGLRLLGKREFGQLSPLELVTLLLIPEIVSQGLGGEDYSLVGGIIGVATPLVLVFLTSLAGARWERVGTAIDGTPTVLAHEGRFFEKNMMAERVTPDEVYTELRKAGFEELRQARWVILETDGSLSIVPKPGEEGEPATRKEREPRP